MRILYAPMAVSLPANGPYSQLLSFREAALEGGIELAAAAARDAAWHGIPGLKNYPVPVPRLGGWIPAWVVGPIVRPLFLKGEEGAQRMRMRSFEQVQASLGLAGPGYFFRDMKAIKAAMRDFKPDAIIAGRYSAILAAKEAGIPSVAILDRPQTSSFASDPALTRRLRAEISRRGLGSYASVLDIAYEANLLVVPNLRELADIGSNKAVYVGPFKRSASRAGESLRDTILCYAGVSGLDPVALARALDGMACAADMRILVASPGRSQKIGHVELLPRFDVREELRRARLVVHHGGQNSCYDCLLEGIAQLAIPCGHFERSANARAVVQAGAGLAWEEREGPELLEASVGRLLTDASFARRAAELGAKLRQAGGWDAALRAISGLTVGGRA